jgi:7-cyano-7-deazaguanine synthase
MVVLSLSGGLDSAVLFAMLKNEGKEVMPVFFQYGSRNHAIERSCARSLLDYYGVDPTCLVEVDLIGMASNLKSGLLATYGGALPAGHFTDESMKQTIVPARNLIFVSIMAGIAESHGVRDVYVGIQAGDTDRSLYPDCRPVFLAAARNAVLQATDLQVYLHYPFMNFAKETIVRMGCQLKVPFDRTRSCYQNTQVACGTCGACQKRLWAFYKVGEVDPLLYNSRELIQPKE